MKDQTKILAALLIGAAAGAALGLLFAPEKGETVREGVADFIDDLIDVAKNKAGATTEDLKEFSNSIIEQAKSKIKESVDQATEHLNDVKSKIKNTAADVNNSVQNV